MAFTYVTSAHNRYGKRISVNTGDTYTKGQVLQWDLTTGVLIPANNTTTFSETEFVANEAFPNTADVSQNNDIHVWKIDSNNQFIADTVNNSSTAHNGQRMILDATGLLANNTGTDSSVGVFRQTGVVGAPANRQIIGEFVSK